MIASHCLRKFVSSTQAKEIKNDHDAIEVIQNFETSSSCSNLFIYPNYQPAWLQGPSGYVAVLNERRHFTDDIFRCEKFRVITMQEVNIKQAEVNKLLTRVGDLKIEKRLRKCLPIGPDQLSPIHLESNVWDGWSPVLGERGCSIGLYSYQERTEKNTTFRYFIICHSGLPDATYNLLLDRDRDIFMSNYLLNLETEHIEDNNKLNSKLAEFNNGSQGGNTRRYIHTYGHEFDPHYQNENLLINQRMLQISKENNKRLILMYSELLDIPLTVEERHWNSAVDGGHVQYDVPESSKKIIHSMSGKTLEGKLRLSLKWWPVGAPIYSFTCIPKLPHVHPLAENVSDDLDYHSLKDITGFPLGYALYVIQTDADFVGLGYFETLKKEFTINFASQPSTFEAMIETDYNTFRSDNLGNILWYNNVTPINTTTDTKGILVQHRLQNGYECIYSSHFNPTVSNGITWTNEFANGFPVIYPYESEDGSVDVTREDLNTFFTLTRGGKSDSLLVTNIPKPLAKPFKTGGEGKGELLGSIAGMDGISIYLTPITVYCSENILSEPEYELIKLARNV